MYVKLLARIEMTKQGKKRSIRRRLPNSVTDLPTGVQKSYFMLSDAERTVLNKALEKYQPGRSEPIFVGDHKVLKPALRLMTRYRLKIEEILDGPGGYELHTPGRCCA